MGNIPGRKWNGAENPTSGCRPCRWMAHRVTIIDLLRHGALDGGVRYRGVTEASLTADGRASMDAVWHKVESRIDTVITSPLSRCHEPAEAWAKGAGIAFRVEPDIGEMNFGVWEGLAMDEIEERFPGVLSRWRENPAGIHIPGAECIENFSGRVIEAWEDIRHESVGKHVLVVAHSGSLRIILAHVLGAPLATIRRFSMPYASWSRVISDNGKPYLEYLNRPV